MNSQKYLQRIGLEIIEIKPNLENLKLLQKQHLLNVPFENLDIHWNRKIVLDTDKFYKKVVKNKRGGFCYELNGLFNELLKAIGYKTKIISARVSKETNSFGEEYDHLAILTEIDGKKYLVDVGFGDFIAEPLEFSLDLEQKDANGFYLIRKYDEDCFEVAKKAEKRWNSEYIFKDLERDLSEFAEMCHYHQTSPKTSFTQRKVCSLMTEKGRKTLTNKKFIETKDRVKIEFDVNSNKEFLEILEREFGIEN